MQKPQSLCALRFFALVVGGRFARACFLIARSYEKAGTRVLITDH